MWPLQDESPAQIAMAPAAVWLPVPAAVAGSGADSDGSPARVTGHPHATPDAAAAAPTDPPEETPPGRSPTEVAPRAAIPSGDAMPQAGTAAPGTASAPAGLSVLLRVVGGAATTAEDAPQPATATPDPEAGVAVAETGRAASRGGERPDDATGEEGTTDDRAPPADPPAGARPLLADRDATLASGAPHENQPTGETPTLGQPAGTVARGEPHDPGAPGQARPPHHPDLARHAAAQVAAGLGTAEGGRLELTLSPEELGPVRVALMPEDGAIAVHVAAERGETLDLLRRHAEVLARELRQAGYGEVRLDFGTAAAWGEGAAPRHGYGGPPADGDTAAASDPARQHPAARPPRILDGRALDLRL